MNTPDITDAEASPAIETSQESQWNDINLWNTLADYDCIDEYETWLAELREARTGSYERGVEIER